MSAVENKVRSAANALHEAIREARAKGFKVDWPHHVEGLLTIPVSETGKVKPAKAPAATEVSADKPAG